MLQVSFKLGSMEGPPGVWGEQGDTGYLAMGTREQSKTIVRNKGTSNRLGNRGTNTKNYKTLRFLHKRGSDRRFSAVLLMSLASFCSHLSCILVSSSGAEIDLFRHVSAIGLILKLSRAIHAGQSDSVRTVCWYARGVQVRPGQFWHHMCSWWFKWLTGQTRLLLVKIRRLCCNEYVFQRPAFSVWK